MLRVLFVCELNSARSQMAEFFLKRLGGNKDFIVESCGIEAGTLNPLVIEAMDELGYDLSNNTTKTVFDLRQQVGYHDVVISVYPQLLDSGCPIFPRRVRWLHWPFDAPSRVQGDQQTKLHTIRTIRDQIKGRVENFINDYRQTRQTVLKGTGFI